MPGPVYDCGTNLSVVLRLEVQPGTPFEEIPGDWVCTVCGAGNGGFERRS
ncbi:MAG: rubredoxin [Chloroflexi bacterium]|nr:rubredoxin [Chloroflexota bacterium]